MEKIKKVKVAIVSSYPTIDCGVSRYTRELISALTDKQLEVLPYRIFFSREKLKSVLWGRIFCNINKTKPDIIHIQYTPTICGPFILIFFLMYKFFRLKARVVITAHEKPSVYLKHIHKSLRGLFLLYEKIIYNCSDTLIVHTLEHKLELINQYKIMDKKVEIIPHGVGKRRDSDIKLEQGIKNEYHLGESKIITFFGTIRPNKGIEHLIMSFSQLIKKKIDIILLIAGAAQKSSSGYLQELKHLVKSVGVESNVRFTGFIDDEDVPALMDISEIIVMPYVEVTQSGILYREVIPYSKLVIVTDIGDMGDTVKRYGIGLVVPPKDVDALSDAILHIITVDKYELESYKENAVRLINELSWYVVSKLYIELYNKTILEG